MFAVAYMDTYKFTKIYEKHCSVTRNCVNAIKQYLVYFIEHGHHSCRVHEIRYSLSLNLIIETHDSIDFIKNCFMKKIKVNVKQIKKSYKLIPFYAYSTESLICFIIELRNIGGLIYFDCPTVFAQHFSTERLAFLITFIHRQIYRIRNTVFAAKYVIYYSGILIVLKRNSVEMLWYSLYKDNILYLINLIRITF